MSGFDIAVAGLVKLLLVEVVLIAGELFAIGELLEKKTRRYNNNIHC